MSLRELRADRADWIRWGLPASRGTLRGYAEWAFETIDGCERVVVSAPRPLEVYVLVKVSGPVAMWSRDEWARSLEDACPLSVKSWLTVVEIEAGP